MRTHNLEDILNSQYLTYLWGPGTFKAGSGQRSVSSYLRGLSNCQYHGCILLIQAAVVSDSPIDHQHDMGYYVGLDIRSDGACRKDEEPRSQPVFLHPKAVTSWAHTQNPGCGRAPVISVTRRPSYRCRPGLGEIFAELPGGFLTFFAKSQKAVRDCSGFART